MKEYGGYLIDLDGTLFRGDEVIPGALQFIQELQERGIPHLFVTNNSSRSPRWLAQKMGHLGFSVDSSQILTSSEATASYIAKQYDSPAVLAIGEEGLIGALEEAGCRLETEEPEVVVVGIDRRFSYKKMKAACLAIAKGAVLSVPIQIGLYRQKQEWSPVMAHYVQRLL